VTGWLLAPGLPALAQTPPEDVVRAFFEAGSGRAGTQPIDRLPGLFAPSGTLVTVGRTGTGAPQAVVRTPTEYVESARSYLASNTQFETPIRFWVEQYADLAHVFCAFEARRSPDEAPFYRAVASFQLLRAGERWQIITAYWLGERPGAPLPPRYRR
jgi:hypothetical protein